jgi:hypothetical protein
MAFEADYVFTGTRAISNNQDINRAYDPATGLPYSFTDRTRKPYAGWDDVNMDVAGEKSNYHALQTSFTKRMSNRWQASATYTMAGQWNYQRPPVNPGCRYPMTIAASGAFTCDVAITLHPAIAEEWYLTGDQRHRAVFNGIWDAGYGFQVSGMYILGDNGYSTPTSGVDPFSIGTGAPTRIRGDRSLIARNSFNLPSLNRVDMRVQRRFAFTNRAGIDVIAEVFNVFNRANYGSFTLNQSNAAYGQPSFNNNVAFAPRMLQLGFRATF